jgi:hypothetical protein
MKNRYKVFKIATVVSLNVFFNPAIPQPLPKAERHPMNNPALMLGSDFLSLFQAYYKVGDWDMLLKLTSTASRKRYGDARILDFYRRMNLGYRIRLISLKNTTKGYEMTYKAQIQATDVIIRCRVVVERDTCRLVLPDLKNNPDNWRC